MGEQMNIFGQDTSSGKTYNEMGKGVQQDIINDIYHKVKILRKELSHAPTGYIYLLDFGGRTAYRDKQQEESRKENSYESMEDR